MDLELLLQTLANERKQVEKDLENRKRQRMYDLFKINQEKANAIFKKISVLKPIKIAIHMEDEQKRTWEDGRYYYINFEQKEIENKEKFSSYVEFFNKNLQELENNEMNYYLNNACLKDSEKWFNRLTFIENHLNETIEKTILEYNEEIEQMKRAYN